MEKCALCMTDINEGAIICTGCGAVREERMAFFPKMLFWLLFIFSLPFALKLSLQIGWFAIILPIAVIVVAIIYFVKYFRVYWVRKELK